MPVLLFESVCFESLWAKFTASLAVSPDEPMSSERIVVPGSGWESFITRRLAETRGCWAHCRYMSLGRWLSQTIEDVLGDEQAPNRDVDALTWMIAARLPDLLDDSSFDTVREYLQAGGDANGVGRLIDLSRCVAGLFDQYLLLRPDLIAAWESGADWPGHGQTPSHAEWQRKVFEAVSNEHAIRSIQASVLQLDEALVGGSRQLPQRVSVWICSGVPPVHIDFMEVVGRYCDVHVYVLTPSHEYWADMAGRREVMRRFRVGGLTLRQFCEQQHFDLLHPLLDSMARLSQDRQLLLDDRESEAWQACDLEIADADEHEPMSLLTSLQKDLRAALEPKPSTLKADESLTIHSCHSAIREVEVLRDQIRDAMEAQPDLRPEDVAVFCPDLEVYAPLIQAVFGLPGHDARHHLPFHIAGRSPRRTLPIVEAYFKLLETLQGRLTASEVLDLLNVSAIVDAAGITENEVDSITKWVHDAGIRWGLDRDHRRDEQLPDYDLNTWEFGLDRLLMGFAMPPGGGQIVGEVVALDRAEGLLGETLGKLWAFVEQLRQWRQELAADRPWDQWRTPLCRLADQMLATGTDETGVQRILDAVDRLVNAAVNHGFKQPLPVFLVARELGKQVDTMAGGRPFRMGGIVFCEMAAMRSLPFAVIGLLGMNDGIYPRVDRPVGFDLTMHAPQRGDRSVRLEDKHLFLEALLSAGRRMIVTYQGQSVRDQRFRPPSMVVEELLDVIERSSVPAGSDHSLIRQQVVTRHPLQAFSPRYFLKGEELQLFSYEQAHLQVAKALVETSVSPPTFAVRALAEESNLDEIAVRELRLLMERPWELFLKRLGAVLPDAVSADADREPLVLNALERWSAGDNWVQRRLEDEGADSVAARLRRTGGFPGGGLGKTALDAIGHSAEEVVEHADLYGIAGTSTAIPIRLCVGATLVVGHVEDCTPQGIRRATYSKLSARWMRRLWLDHLLRASVATNRPGTALLVGRGRAEDMIEIPPVTQEVALGQLESLVRLYRLARRMPLPFFPDSVEKVMGGASPDLESDTDVQQVIFMARRAFEDQFNGTPAADLPSVRAAFAGQDPFAMTCCEAPGFEADGSMPLFLRLFQVICQPMLDVIQRGDNAE